MAKFRVKLTCWSFATAEVEVEADDTPFAAEYEALGKAFSHKVDWNLSPEDVRVESVERI